MTEKTKTINKIRVKEDNFLFVEDKERELSSELDVVIWVIYGMHKRKTVFIWRFSEGGFYGFIAQGRHLG